MFTKIKIDDYSLLIKMRTKSSWWCSCLRKL